MDIVNKMTVTVDLRLTTHVPLPQFIQDDTNILEFIIKDNGEDADLTNIGRVIVNYKRPSDNLVITRQLEIGQTSISYQIGVDEMKYAGFGELEIQFFSADNLSRISTKRMKISILSSIGTPDATQGSDELTALQDLFIEVFTAKDDANTAADNANTQAIYAKSQGDYAKAQGQSIQTKWLSPVASFSDIEITYQSPSLGDTVQVLDTGYVYRFDESQWVYTQGYSATAIANVNSQLAEIFNQDILYKTLSIHNLSSAYNSTINLDTAVQFAKSINANITAITFESVTTATDSNVTTESDSLTNLNSMISKAVANGIKINCIKPHIVTPQGDLFDRGTYQPNDPTTFFSKWQSILLAYAGICNSNNIEMLCIACEMVNVTDITYLSNWQSLINAIKSQYPNLKLVFAYKQSEFMRDVDYKQQGTQSLSDIIDYIGVNFYFALERNDLSKGLYLNMIDDGTYRVMKGLDYISLSKTLFGKPLLITETGCTKYSDSSQNEINPMNMSGIVDYLDQNTYFSILLSTAMEMNNLLGVSVWSYESPFDLGTDTQNTIKAYFGGA